MVRMTLNGEDDFYINCKFESNQNIKGHELNEKDVNLP